MGDPCRGHSGLQVPRACTKATTAVGSALGLVLKCLRKIVISPAQRLEGKHGPKSQAGW